MVMNPTLVVLAAGLGRRYGGLKQLEPVGPSGEALMEYSIFDALGTGFDRVVLVIRPDTEEEFRSFLGSRLADHVCLSYAHQTLRQLPYGLTPPRQRIKPWGTGHAVLATEDKVRGPFAVINADDFYGRDAFATLRGFLENVRNGLEPIFALLGFRLGPTLSGTGPVSRGLCRVGAGGWLQEIVEVPELSTHDEGGRYTDAEGVERVVASDTLVSMNMWGFSPRVHDELRSRFRSFFEAAHAAGDHTSEFLIPDAVQGMIADGGVRVRVLRHEGQWCGITFPKDRERVRAFITAQVAAGEYPPSLWA
jgi:NDP-sugar pyrophosphorylase family protein